MKKLIEECRIISNETLKNDYMSVVFQTDRIASLVKPGQFIHVKIADLKDRILRRPFSVCDVSSSGELTVVYKIVGEGTRVLSELRPGITCSLMGPLGVPFSVPEKGEIPVLIAGGYGAAATRLLASASPEKGIFMIGARSDQDIILTDKFKDLDFDVRIATEDGSSGIKGVVTLLLEELLRENELSRYRFYACGPKGMLLAVGKILTELGLDAELSLDHLMCCGVGACFACVIKVKADNSDGWRYARTCSEGPVFKASEVVLDQ
jgi:dihydroorotate dehydrogenase electron transfer subunit